MESVEKINKRITEIQEHVMDLEQRTEDADANGKPPGFRHETLLVCGAKIIGIERMIKEAEEKVLEYVIAQREFNTKNRWYQFWNQYIRKAPTGFWQRTLDNEKEYLKKCRKRLKA